MPMTPAERQARLRERQKARVAALEEGAPSSAEMAAHLAERYRQAGAAYLGEGEAATAFLALPSPSAEDLAAMVEAAGREAAKHLRAQLVEREEVARVSALRERAGRVLAERGEVARRFLQDRALQRGGEPQAADYAALVEAAEAGTLLPPYARRRRAFITRS